MKKLFGLIVIISLILINLFNVSRDDLSIDIMGFGSPKVEDENAIEIYIQYDWSKRRFTANSETIEVNWNPEWIVSSYKIEVFQKDEKLEDYYNVQDSGDSLNITLNNRLKFSGTETGSISITLIPVDKENLKQMLNSAASVRYEHSNLLFGQIVKSDSVSWKNEDIINR